MPSRDAAVDACRQHAATVALHDNGSGDEYVIEVEVRKAEERPCNCVAADRDLKRASVIDHPACLFAHLGFPSGPTERKYGGHHQRQVQDQPDESMLPENLEIDAVRRKRVIEDDRI